MPRRRTLEMERGDSTSHPIFDLPVPVDHMSASVTVTGGGTVHTKGAWTQLLAATTGDAHWVIVQLSQTTSATGADSSALMDLGTGGAGAEVPLVANFPVGFTVVSNPHLPWCFPIFVPSGARLSARLQAITANKTAVTTVRTLRLPRPTPGIPRRLVTMGANLATSSGVASSANNTWVEVIAATTEPFQALIALPTGSTATMTAATALAMDVGVGAAGVEQVFGSRRVSSTASEVMQALLPSYQADGIHVGHVPAGSRLSYRWATASPRAMIIMGVPYE